jgi:hypothetical protein
MTIVLSDDVKAVVTIGGVVEWIDRLRGDATHLGHPRSPQGTSSGPAFWELYIMLAYSCMIAKDCAIPNSISPGQMGPWRGNQASGKKKTHP